MSDSAIKQIEDTIARDKKVLERGDSLERLQSNRDFKKLIRDGYFSEEAVRLVHLKADPSQQTPDAQAAILRQVDAIGALVTYLRVVEQQAAIARKSIDTNEEEIQLLTQEGAE